MNLRTLEYLVKVAETRHFSKAANQCCVTQPTLSTQLKKLENHLGVIIFERDNKNVMLTPLGAKLVNQAKQVLLEAKQLKVIAKNSINPLSGKYNLGIIPSIGPYLIPHLLQKTKTQLKDLKVYVVEDRVESLLDMLKNGQLDAVLLSTPFGNKNHLSKKVLFNEEFFVAMQENHTLASKDFIKIEDLASETMLALDDHHCMRAQTQDILTNKPLSKEFKASSLATLKHLVAQGHGLTIIPKMVCNDLPSGIIIKPIHTNEDKFSREVSLVTRQLCVRNEANNAIVDIIKNCQ
ncbi:MAG: LysR substrate-binding domain-containing protein [Gammaproteobacteria bacterium]|nr:LysR substrate-binding domain-containing protein [Gammaproteobacteria bacterium]